jgi:hypothetical protein
MKRKTDISVQDNRGSRRTSDMHVSEEYHGYIPGDILDANMVVKLILDAIAGISIEGGDLLPNSVTSETIADKTIKIQDLSDEVADKLESTYATDSETLYLNTNKIN